MKKFTLGLAFLTILASCSNSQKEDQLQSKQYTIDSLNTVAAQKEAEHKVVVERQKTIIYQPAANTSSSTSTTTTTATKKKGWSNVAKGAVIGGVVGAGTGVAVSRNKVKGGIVGGVVGAAAGAGVGAILDKKKAN
jgi:hypothetical protein